MLRSEVRRSLQIGRWGLLELRPGYYLYIGSACGPGGVRARVSRHCRVSKPRHWHIDYLRDALDVVCVWLHYSDVRYEHHWAGILAGMRGATPVKGFGCSDCHCESHLFHFR
jgi:Uri superfamily endonuclease